MSGHRDRFKLVYVDAFAGTGYRRVSRLAERSGQTSLFGVETEYEVAQLRDGSARIALALDSGFDAYIFVECDRSHCAELLRLQEQRPDARIDVRCADANVALASIANRPWESWRGVIFLDPFGMQVNWNTLGSIAGTGALDVWLLVPLSIGPGRMLQKRLSDLDRHPGWRSRLDAFFGTGAWEAEFFGPNANSIASGRQGSLFGDQVDEDERYRVDAVNQRLASFYIRRLKTIFPFVSEHPRLLRNSRGQPLYMLCFAVANPRPRAAEIALRIADHVLTAPD